MGAYLSEPITKKESASGGGNGHNWGSSCMQGWRTGMEDAHVTISDLGGVLSGKSFFAVFDGHGGQDVASFCERHMSEELLNLVSSGKSQDMSQLLKSVFHRMDDMLREDRYQEEVLQYKKNAQGPSVGSDPKERATMVLEQSLNNDMNNAKARGSLSKQEAQQMMMKMMMLKKAASMKDKADGETDDGVTRSAASHVGCTSVVVVMDQSSIVCANAGDSRAILCRKGRPVELSFDHKPILPGEKSRIEAAGGTINETQVGNRAVYRVNGNLNLSRSIGDLEYKQRYDLPPEQQVICSTPDIKVVSLTPEDEFVVLACDGVWDVKSNQEVCTFIRTRLLQGQPITQVMEQLLDACITKDPKKTQGLGADNMTCVVVQLDQWKPAKAPTCNCILS